MYTASLDRARLCLAADETFWHPLSLVDQTVSTNADAAKAAQSGAPEGYVRISSYQSGGRGRFDRTWSAPPGTAVAVSTVVRPVREASAWGWLPLLCGIAVVDAVRDAGLAASLKWPNDVLVGDKKVCGILCERIATADGAAAVLGMGVNICQTAEQLPVPTATSLRLAGSSVDATSFTTALLRSLERWYRGWNDGLDLSAAYRERCSTLGLEVEVHGTETVRGRAVDVRSDGSLVVEVNGRPRAFPAGDVVHLRRPEV